jgi:hypothetical protein
MVVRLSDRVLNRPVSTVSTYMKITLTMIQPMGIRP